MLTPSMNLTNSAEELIFLITPIHILENKSVYNNFAYLSSMLVTWIINIM
jgi:hypothetical protein